MIEIPISTSPVLLARLLPGFCYGGLSRAQLDFFILLARSAITARKCRSNLHIICFIPEN